MAKGEEKKYAKIRSLRDIIGGINSTKEQREIAWQKLLPIEDNFGFSTIIAAKYSWLEFSKKYKEKSWKELIRRRIKDDMLSLHYLSANAPEPWCDLAKKLENELEEKLAKKVK